MRQLETSGNGSNESTERQSRKRTPVLPTPPPNLRVDVNDAEDDSDADGAKGFRPVERLDARAPLV